MGRVTSVSYSTSAVLAYSYDAKDRVSNRKTSANGITVNSQFSYNDFGQLSYFYDNLGNGQGYEVVYRFDHLKRPTARWMPVGFTTSYTYLQGEDNQATSLVDTLTIGSDCYHYTYDAFGNITAIYLNDQLYESYTYDGLNQLISVTRGTDTYTYTYDSRGNILSETKNGTVTKSYTYGNNDWKDLLTEYNGTDIDYDEIGNPLNWKNGETLTWSNGRRLMGVGNNISYTYNADGLRTSKTVNGTTTTFTYAEGMLLGETTGSNSIRYLYEDTSVPYGFIYNGTAYFYAFNVQGDVIGIMNTSGTKVVSYEYSAWGEVLSITGTLADTIGQINSIRYRGYYYDNETNLYYLQSRYYDAEVGRFLNADGYVSTGQGVLGNNMFTYCGNNPVNREDSTGQFWKKIGKLVSNAWNGIKSFVSNTFGIGATATFTNKSEIQEILPEPLPITIEKGNIETGTIQWKGDSSKPISLFGSLDFSNEHSPLSGGLKFNFNDFDLTMRFGANQLEIVGVSVKGIKENSIGIMFDTRNVRIEVEKISAIIWDDTSVGSYTNVGVNVLLMLSLACQGAGQYQPVWKPSTA